MDDQSDKISRLEDRIEQLEATTKKMMPTRRDALKFGGAAAIGAAAMSGTGSAGSSQVGTIGTAGNLVDVEAEDINVNDTITTQNLVVNGTASGPFGGGGGVVLQAGDTITVQSTGNNSTNQSLITLYSGTAKDVLGGTIAGGGFFSDFEYTFDDNSTLQKSGGSGSYSFTNANDADDANNDKIEIDFLPPALSVIEIKVGMNTDNTKNWAAEVILKD